MDASNVTTDSTSPPFGPIVDGTQIVFFHYRPNAIAGWIFVVLFGLAAAAHCFLLFRLRAWHFMPLILGVIGEAGGYYGRVWASQEPNEAGPFIVQNLLILGMAPLVAATVYLSLGRITTALDLREHLLIRPGVATAFYIIIDIGCFVTQVVGSVVPASGDPEGIALGRNLVIGGLIAQLVAVSLFLLSVGAAHRAAKKHLWANTATVSAVSTFEPSMCGSSLAACKKSFSSKYFKVSYATAAVLLIRAVVRGVEHVQGEEGYLSQHEAFLYVFDALPVFLVALLYVFVHPGRLVRDARSLKASEESLLSK